MNAGTLLDTARQILAMVAQVETLSPQLAADYAGLKAKLSSDDDAVIRSAIDNAHALSQSLTEQLNATADPKTSKKAS
jgi:hypothetical protein